VSKAVLLKGTFSPIGRRSEAKWDSGLLDGFRDEDDRGFRFGRGVTRLLDIFRLKAPRDQAGTALSQIIRGADLLDIATEREPHNGTFVLTI
jgi:hypothetical protein